MYRFPKNLLAALLALPLAACGGGGGGGSGTTTSHGSSPSNAQQILFAGQQPSANANLATNAAVNEVIYAAGTDNLQRLGTLSLSGGAAVTNYLYDPSQQYMYFQGAPASATTGGSTPVGIYNLATGAQSSQTLSNPLMGEAVDSSGNEYMFTGFVGQPGYQSYHVGSQGQLTAADAFDVNGVSMPTSFAQAAPNEVLVAGEAVTPQNVEVGLYSIATDPKTQQSGYLSLIGSAQSISPPVVYGSSAASLPEVYTGTGWGSAYVYAVDSPTMLYGMSLNANSGLGTPVANPVTGAVAGIAASTTAHYLYTSSLAAGHTGCVINGYATNPSGQLRPINQGNPLFSQPQDAVCVVQFNGLPQSPAVIVSALVVSQQTGSVQTVLSTFSINADGTWSPTGSTTVPMPKLSNPFGSVDMTNQRFFMLTPSGINGWSIAPNGALTPINNGAPLATPDSNMVFSNLSLLPNVPSALQ